MSVERPVALQTLGVLPMDPISMQTLGVLSAEQPAAQLGQSSASQSRGGGGGGLPRWRWPENQQPPALEAPPPTALASLDAKDAASQIFTRRKAERIAAQIGILADDDD